MLLYLTVVFLAVIAGLLVYRYDLYDKEPWWMLLIAAAAGAAMMWANGHLQLAFLGLLGIEWSDHVPRAAIAAVCEESERLIIVLAIAILFRRHFNDPIDGLIYGSIVGLGMAAEESWFFLSSREAAGPLLPPAELVRLCGHLVMGGVTCFALGMWRMQMKRWHVVMLACVFGSMTMHFLWDWLAFSVRGNESMPLWKTLASIIVMLSGMLAYGMLVVVGSDWSRKVFAPHTPAQLWGWPLSLLKPKPAA